MATPNAVGKITQVIGAVVDVQFETHLPAILNALETTNGGNRSISESRRCVLSPWTLRKVWSVGKR
jgi:F0F1-type ATP synthase beta subunit